MAEGERGVPPLPLRSGAGPGGDARDSGSPRTQRRTRRPRHERECRERRRHERHRNSGEQGDRTDRPPPEEPTGRAAQERDVAGEVQRRPDAERDRGDGLELLTHVGDGLLEPECEEHDAGDHREVEVAVRVQGDPVQLDPARLHQPPPREDRGDVEVEPPERGDDDDSEHRRGDHPRVQLEAGANADRDDRLAERDQDDQSVSLGEVLGRDLPPATAADDGRSEIVESEGHDPDRDALVPVEEPGGQDQEWADDRGRHVADERASPVRSSRLTVVDSRRCSMRTSRYAMPKSTASSPNAPGTARAAQNIAHIAPRIVSRTPPSSTSVALVSQE